MKSSSVKEGRLSALEFAWVTYSAPTQMPDPNEVEMGLGANCCKARLGEVFC